MQFRSNLESMQAQGNVFYKVSFCKNVMLLINNTIYCSIKQTLHFETVIRETTIRIDCQALSLTDESSIFFEYFSVQHHTSEQHIHKLLMIIPLYVSENYLVHHQNSEQHIKELLWIILTSLNKELLRILLTSLNKELLWIICFRKLLSSSPNFRAAYP
jgi:hypothetical protein